MSLRKDLVALYTARLDQVPQWQESIRHGLSRLPPQEALELAYELLIIQREITLRLADEIETLRAEASSPRPHA